MPAIQADLHNHTPLIPSDYRGDLSTTPHDIVERALDVGLDIFAVTDHFSCAFVSRMVEAAAAIAQEAGRELFVVPGVEMRIVSGNDEAHIVALADPDSYEADFASLFASLGLDEELVGHKALSKLTVKRDPVAVCREIEAFGGIAIVAHVDRAFGEYRLLDTGLFDRLRVEPSVMAIDVLDQHQLGPHVGAHNVSVIGCSDSHSLAEIGRRRTLLAMRRLDFDSLRLALARRATVALAS